ncbi:uncharacterized protein RAG0_08458 [Rhynchosporium agropyri]|uniref:Uncharacterized protein n=1 Tax=Rhynchosporium agropyri TaxID=914238 RepID=A0A1E1KR08_9HELO|nr:uncharacterized protein RAG0_08458 [Rhynchosporium agropyri]
MKLASITAFLALCSQVALGCQCRTLNGSNDGTLVPTLSQGGCDQCNGKWNSDTLQCSNADHKCFNGVCTYYGGPGVASTCGPR